MGLLEDPDDGCWTCAQSHLMNVAVLYEMAQDYWQELMPGARWCKNSTLRLQYFDRQFRPDAGCRRWWVFSDDERIGFASVEIRDNPAGQPWG